MKGLSIEEKAKRFDEAIEKAKYYYDEGKTLEYANDIVSDIFPELKESEDERIRKKLISYFSAVKGFSTLECNYGITNEDAVAWLERQSKQKSYGQRQECVDCQFNYAGECKGSCAMKRVDYE